MTTNDKEQKIALINSGRYDLVINETDNAYLAGLIDGEGCISLVVQKGKNAKRYDLKVIIRMVDLNALLFAQLHYGGRITITKNLPPRRNTFVLSFYGKKACWVLKEILPYLKVKKKQASIAISFIEDSPKKMNSPCAYGEFERRTNLWLEMRRLNKRGC